MKPDNQAVGKYLVELMIEQYPHANLASLVDVCAGLIVATLSEAHNNDVAATEASFDGLAAHMRAQIAQVIDKNRKAGLQ